MLVSGVIGVWAQTEPKQASLQEAQVEITAGHFAAAENICRRLQHTSPNDVAVSQALALALYLQGKDTQAIDVLRPVTERSPNPQA